MLLWFITACIAMSDAMVLTHEFSSLPWTIILLIFFKPVITSRGKSAGLIRCSGHVRISWALKRISVVYCYVAPALLSEDTNKRLWDCIIY